MNRIFKGFSFLVCICMVFVCISCNKPKSSDSKTEKNPDIYSFTFEIDGESYTLPQSIDAFTKNGWSFSQKLDTANTTITSKNLKETYLEKGNKWFAVEIFNYSDNDLPLLDCPIGRITYDFSEDIEIVMSGDFKLNGKSIDQVIEKYGEPMSNKNYGNYTELIYDKNPNEGTYDRYVLKFDSKTKIIKNFDVTYFYD